MSIKKIVSAQYRHIVNESALALRHLKVPPEGWIRTMRKALGMSTVQLAERLEVTRVYVSKIEKDELNTSVTLRTMTKVAEALGCRFIYAIVPEDNVENLVLQQAKLKAKQIVDKANVQMALEAQLLTTDQIQAEIERLTDEIIREKYSSLWDAD